MILNDAQRAELEADVVQLCQELIQIPSVNFGEGKGDEEAAAKYVAAKLEEVGIKTKIYESAPKRCSVVARVEGSLWARHGFRPERTMVIVFFGDEEAGGIFGSRWMAEKHPEVFAGCSEAVSEVGGFSLTLNSGKRIYLIETAEKGIEWMKLTAEGTAGHGSMVNRENAITRLADAVSRIGNYKWPQRITKTNEVFLRKIAELTGKTYDPNNLAPILNEVGSISRMMGATLSNTANPSMLEGGYKANVIPQTASAVVDGRTLPGYEQELLDTVKQLAGEHVKVESLVSDIPLEVDFSGPLVEKMVAAIRAEDPEGIPVPYVMSGGTDNKALAKLGLAGYGFSPLKLPPELDFLALFHGVDERVPIDSLKFGARSLQTFLANA